MIVSDNGLYPLNGCQAGTTHVLSGCAWLDRGGGEWTIQGPLLVNPSPITVRVITAGKMIVATIPVKVEMRKPPG